MTKNGQATRPIGIYLLIIWQTIVSIYCILRLVNLTNVIYTGGTEFGLSNPDYLKVLFFGVAFINIVCIIGVCKKLNWGRIIYMVSILFLILLRVLQSISVIRYNNFEYFVNTYLNMNEALLNFINIMIVLYLATSKKVSKYFN